jgi:hypothetical protein
VSEVRVVYKCVLCPKAFDNVQSLRAHMKVHRDVEFEHFHVRLPRAKVEEFKEFCRRHNTTTCHMILAMIDAYIEGDKRGLIQIGSTNPAIVHLQQFFASRPRGHGKYDTTSMLGFEPETPRVYCVFCGGFSGGLVFCQRYGSDWLPASRCADCPSNWFKKKGG